jgi:hypothetical protein
MCAVLDVVGALGNGITEGINDGFNAGALSPKSNPGFERAQYFRTGTNGLLRDHILRSKSTALGWQSGKTSNG